MHTHIEFVFEIIANSIVEKEKEKEEEFEEGGK